MGIESFKGVPGSRKGGRAGGDRDLDRWDGGSSISLHRKGGSRSPQCQEDAGHRVETPQMSAHGILRSPQRCGKLGLGMAKPEMEFHEVPEPRKRRSLGTERGGMAGSRGAGGSWRQIKGCREAPIHGTRGTGKDGMWVPGVTVLRKGGSQEATRSRKGEGGVTRWGDPGLSAMGILGLPIVAEGGTGGCER